VVPVFILINYGSSANVCMFCLIISNLLEPVYRGVTNGGRGGAVAPGEAGQGRKITPTKSILQLTNTKKLIKLDQ